MQNSVDTMPRIATWVWYISYARLQVRVRGTLQAVGVQAGDAGIASTAAMTVVQSTQTALRHQELSKAVGTTLLERLLALGPGGAVLTARASVKPGLMPGSLATTTSACHCGGDSCKPLSCSRQLTPWCTCRGSHYSALDLLKIRLIQQVGWAVT